MKTALAAKRKSVQSEITVLKRKRRELAKGDSLAKSAKLNELDVRINGLTDLLNLYKASVVPVKFENGLVLNGTLLKQFVKKLPNLCVAEARFLNGGLLLNYKTKFAEGDFALYNLAEYYEGFNMQNGEELLEELGIQLKQVRKLYTC